jgi:hypothetical protein
MRTTILSASYFPPVPWFAAACRAKEITIDVHEHYLKQTWRNRCSIVTANGLMNLVVPVEKYRNHTPVREIRVDYATNWQRVHEHAIRSAYGKSAYFEFYADKLLSIFEWQPESLVELTTATHEAVIELLKLDVRAALSSEYLTPAAGEPDWRKLIVPGGTDTRIPETETYLQVFQERHGFIPGLSILDLLFCTGPDAKRILSGAK